MAVAIVDLQGPAALATSCRAASAEDLFVWRMRRLAESAHGPMAVDRALREEVVPLLLRVGPAAREPYIKEAAQIFGVTAKAVREILAGAEGLAQTSKRKGSGFPTAPGGPAEGPC